MQAGRGIRPGQRRPAIQGLAESIQQPSEALDGYRHPQRPATIEHRRAAPQARGAIQGDGAHLVRVEMVQHLEHRTPAVDGYRERPMQRRQRLAGDVHHRPVYLNHMADGSWGGLWHNHLLRMGPASAGRCASSSCYHREVLLTKLQGNMDKADEYRDLDQWSDYGRKGLAGIDPEDGHSHSDGELEIIGGSGK